MVALPPKLAVSLLPLCSVYFLYAPQLVNFLSIISHTPSAAILNLEFNWSGLVSY